MGEFELIQRYFTRPAGKALLGVGDDCALLSCDAASEIAISSDMLVEGRHFLAGTNPFHLGWKALAVNLSDLAAVAANPLAFSLALALPDADPQWLQAFSQGLFNCADQFDCELIGGDTTRGPRNICITVLGKIPCGQAIRRSGAQVGDDLWVSGTLGDAALGLRCLKQQVQVPESDRHALITALEQPQPRLALGIKLRGIATAMLDISDGLLGDLRHVLNSSQVGACIDLHALPISPSLRAQAYDVQLECALAGGDDYELCFSAPASQRAAVAAAANASAVMVSRIGWIESGAILRCADTQGAAQQLPSALNLKGFDHFA